MNDSRLSSAALVSALLAAAFVLMWGGSRLPELAYDDAFITYRYADNWRRGLGLVFNPGEYVLGTTTPLFALLLGMAGRLWPDIVAWGHWLSVSAWAATAILVTLWLLDRRRPVAALAAPWLIALQPALLLSLGMETALLVALMAGVGLAWHHQRRWMVVILGAGLLLVRPDSALWLLVLGLAAWQQKGRLPWREGAGVALLLAPWLVYATFRYGAPWPNSAAAKIGQNTLMPVAEAPLFPLAWWDALAGGWPWPLTILFGGALITAVWPWPARPEGSRLARWLLLWIVLYLATYAMLDVVTFPWYFVPPLVVAHLGAALGLGRWAAHSRLGVLAVIVFLAGLAVSQLPAMSAALSEQGHRADYLPAATWLRENTGAEATVATIEIGVVGYYSQRPLLDTMGLVSRSMTDHQLGWRETLVYALNGLHPDYALALPGTAWDWVTSQTWFQRSYEPAAVMGEVTIYRHRPMATAVEREVDVAYADGLLLTSLSVDRQDVTAGEAVMLDAVLHVESAPGRDLVLTAVLIPAGESTPVAVARTVPFDGGYAASLWQPGDRLTIPVTLETPAGLPDGAYRLGLLLYDPRSERFLPPVDAPDDPFPAVTGAWLRVGGPGDRLADEAAVIASWEDGIRLLDRRLTAGDSEVMLHLTWAAAVTPERDWVVFTHLVDETGRIVAQHDSPPRDGRLPTPAWRPGEPITDSVSLPLPADAATGDYGIRLGFYIGDKRLPLADGSGDFVYWPDVVSVLSTGEIRIQGGDVGGE